MDGYVIGFLWEEATCGCPGEKGLGGMGSRVKIGRSVGKRQWDMTRLWGRWSQRGTQAVAGLGLVCGWVPRIS